MRDFFCFGPLADRRVLHEVLGREVPDAKAAVLFDHEAIWRSGERIAALRKVNGASVAGLLLPALKAEDRRRMDFYLADPDQVVSVVDTGEAESAVCVSRRKPEGEAWPPNDWDAVWRDIMVLAASEFMEGFSQVSAEVAAQRYPVMLMRAGAKARAMAREVPASLRSVNGREHVEIADFRRPYSHFFTIEEHDLRFQRFDGTMSQKVTRATFVDGDAITVLPYDPQRDRVLLVEQFRLGPYVRGENKPWMLEAVAGRIDPGETPEAAARRELLEETGVEVRELLPVASYYPSSGAVTGYFFSYVALSDLPDEVVGVSGLESEAEDIRSHVVAFDDAMSLIASGEAEAGPMIMSMFWLEARRAELRKDA